MMRQFWRTGGTPQTWTPVNYPGLGFQNNRIYLTDESIDWQTPDVPDSDKIMEYRTTVNIIMEGYSLDLDYQFAPALWTLIASGNPGTVDELKDISPVDLRVGNANPDMAGHADIPANGTGTVPVLSTTSVQFVSFGSFLQILGAMLGHRVGVIRTDTPCFCTGSCTVPGVHKRQCKCDNNFFNSVT